MPWFKRKLYLSQLLDKKSFFLFGPRGTGKSTLIEHQLPGVRVYDLLDADTFQRLVRRPKILMEENPTPENVIAIDEIQKYPPLLDEVQRLIQKHHYRFLLTGSSARKLKRGAANLLGGRAWEANLFALTSCEIPNFNLLKYLNTGGLPYIYGKQNAKEELRAYVSTYLREEIQAEAATRNLSAFTEFLDLIALNNGNEINFESFAADCGVSAGTLKNYIQILEDTLIGFTIPGFTGTKKRKAVSRGKHYFFDVGVLNSLTHRGEIEPKSELFGNAFEHFIILELRAYLSYSRSFEKLTYWRSTSQFEVDALIGKQLALEIKSTNLAQDKHLKGLRALKEEKIFSRYILISLDPERRMTDDGIQIMPWEEFLLELWAGKLLMGFSGN